MLRTSAKCVPKALPRGTRHLAGANKPIPRCGAPWGGIEVTELREGPPGYVDPALGKPNTILPPSCALGRPRAEPGAAGGPAHATRCPVPSGVCVQNIPGPRGSRGKAQEHSVQLAARAAT